jgi:hypothetical protein
MNYHLSMAVAIVAFFLLAATHQVWAGCGSYSDLYDNTSLKCNDGTAGNSSTEPYGNTSGAIGDSYNSYSERPGKTSGSVGGRSFDSYSDSYGSRSGSGGGGNVNCYTDNYGNTSCN